ncbi:hypothetical protein BVC80_1835g536 [Macleaya cordata]|uniref:Transmembrane protein n=1 Tax=Macleaya cordata TaxID=56857 RepID=A0A200R606_MACCD|nr:hypothetical protein BVC80_1835g536 [Macleaya cordata]
MDLKFSVAFLSVLLLVLTRPTLSQGRSDAMDLMNNNDMYEIDYRGPETHSHVPPPYRSGDSPFIHHKTTVMASSSSGPKFKGSRALNGGSIHG